MKMNDPYEFHEDENSIETRYVCSSKSSEHELMELTSDKYTTEDFKIWKRKPGNFLKTSENVQVSNNLLLIYKFLF